MTTEVWTLMAHGGLFDVIDHEGLAVACSLPKEDACKVAAAPDMYNALSVLADAAESRGIPVDAARSALAKARGEK